MDNVSIHEDRVRSYFGHLLVHCPLILPILSIYLAIALDLLPKGRVNKHDAEIYHYLKPLFEHT